MKKEKSIRISQSVITGLLSVLFLLASSFGFYPFNANAATDATLQFDQSSVSANAGDTVTLIARVNPGTNEVGAAELDVTFNPTILRLDSITRSSAFNTTLSGPTIDNDGSGNTDGNGSIDAGLLTSPPTYITTTADIATFVFTSLAAATNSPVGIAVTSDASSHGEYVVSTRTGATVTVIDVEADSTPPTTPANLTGVANSSSKITLLWEASSGPNLVGYRIYRNNSVIATASSLSYADTGLSQSNTYNYGVSAYDSYSNESAQAAVSVKTEKKSSNSGGSSNKKKSSSDKYTISNSSSSILWGGIITQSGKKFSRNKPVALYFSKFGGGYYPPKIVQTDQYGRFSLTAKIYKPRGTYKWYAINLATGARSNVKSYKIK